MIVMNYKIAVISGDGIGPEIVREARKVLDVTGKKYGFSFDYTDLLMGGASIDVNGVPLTDETKNLFNAKSIAEMKDGAVVLNMARGGIVNEQDMYEALKAGKIGGYASDVMENELAGGGLTEGAGFDSPLFECENFLVSPHLGAQSTDASRDIGAHIIAKVKEALNLG